VCTEFDGNTSWKTAELKNEEDVKGQCEGRNL